MRRALLFLVLAGLCPAPWAQTIVRDGAIELPRSELQKIFADTGRARLSAAASDEGERLELINDIVQGKKMAAAAAGLSPEDEGYWELQLALDRVRQRFLVRRYLATLELPDSSALAREWYQLKRDEYAKVPETRKSSHILFFCPPGCDRGPLRPKAAKVLAELRDGADFASMVDTYSEDKASKARDGHFDRWIRLGDPSITPRYSQALFEIEKIGEYSEVTDSEFGLHIIRLEDVRPSRYRSFEEVKAKIVEDIQREYRELALKEFRKRFMVSEDLKVDGDVFEAMLDEELERR